MPHIDEADYYYTDDDEASPRPPIKDNPAGRRRPLIDYDGRKYPIPWSMGIGVSDLSKIDPKRAMRVEQQGLCLVCGEPNDETRVFATFFGMNGSDRRKILGGPPIPTWGHAECILKAALFCPHLKRFQERVAQLTLGGATMSTEELKAYVSSIKKGKRDEGN